MKGYFVSFEGPDGAGKSTVLKEVLAEIGPELRPQYLVTREPGGSKIAEKIRDIILDPANDEMNAKTEALLYAASRSQHVEEIIRPALKTGKLVFSDRFVDSSLAYQGEGRDLGIAEVKQINDFATGKLDPDLTFFLDVAPEVGLSRIKKLRPDQEDRLEQENLAFHKKVYAGFQKIKQMYPERFVTIDATQPIEQVVKQVIITLKQRMPEIF
ncbi:dTMP kinase [Lactobacillus kefiranofaciens]|uniref:Thymidylate kinase n=1 Tax=Lactobacillus kefiranofaciens TaxID=267818 RepID=A0AAX3UGS1_9LACO|nr:dTMP kinase [Lactobacillus kefiranofaciens]AEG39773.1 Thymidylate kinase [Lactobacillus kefiranofaciens subsp. kefiranofaciens]MCJ2171561.1 dTMP kinase [Lactobacillus kefiranofaciens]MCP9330442.1 dTMP kinase [Lactobacillus kefiranofaciens]MDF4141519.1 dTMP kinase [Lactobacillus kefiranofaciens]PAK99203.1 dTMP kinase [Lactobacillus kefiranofaciens]